MLTCTDQSILTQIIDDADVVYEHTRLLPAVTEESVTRATFLREQIIIQKWIAHFDTFLQLG